MAGELSISLSITANKAPTMVNDGVAYGFAQDMAGKYKEETIQTFTVTPAAFRIGSITTPGYVAVRNTGNANNLLISNGSGGAPVISIPPQGACLFPSATTTLFGAASSGTIDAKLTTFEQ